MWKDLFVHFLQLRIRDLEAALEAEKSQKIETSAVTDNLNKQIR